MDAPIVGDQYVISDDATYSIARKELALRDGNFTITDDDGNPLFKLNEQTISLRDKRTMYDASDSPVVSMKKKLITLHDTWEVYAGDSDDVIFTVKKAHLTDREGESYEVQVTGTDEAQYLLNGDFPKRHYTIIYNGDNVIAEVSKAHFKLSNLFSGRKHKYGVRVNGGADIAFVGALVTIIDSIHSESGDDSDSD